MLRQVERDVGRYDLVISSEIIGNVVESEDWPGPDNRREITHLWQPPPGVPAHNASDGVFSLPTADRFLMDQLMVVISAGLAGRNRRGVQLPREIPTQAPRL